MGKQSISLDHTSSDRKQDEGESPKGSAYKGQSQKGDNILAMTRSFLLLGSEVRQVRKARRMRLKELAKAADISISHLSAIERGTVNPSLDAVYRISEALNISSDWFFARCSGRGPMEQAYIVRRQNRRNINKLYGESAETLGLTDQLLSSSISGTLCMGIATYEPNSYRAAHPMYQHDGEQHGYVVEGELIMQIGDEEIVLRQGDSYSFPTNIPHNARNDTDRPSRLLWAVSPIVVPKDVVLEQSRNKQKG